VTHRQKSVYDFIRVYWNEHGRSPTYKEIATDLDISNKSLGRVFYAVRALEEQRWVRVVRGKHRGIIPLIPTAA